MGRLSILEDFGEATPAGVASPAPSVPVSSPPEADRLSAWEEGYRSGYDDALRAEAQNQARIGAELERTLQELSFTFHEARTQVTDALRPLLTEMTATLLPGLERAALDRIVWDALEETATARADAPLELLVSSADLASVEALAARHAMAHARVTAEPTLGPGQAYLRTGNTERHVDLAAALEEIQQAIGALFEDEDRMRRHG